MIKIQGKQAKVCIDPGHGGADPGAVGPTGLREDDTVLKVSKELMYCLDLLGIDSELTRTEDVGLQLSERVEKSKGSHCFISIHCNAHASNAEGIETVYPKSAGLHKALANTVQQSLMKQFKGHKNRGLKMSPSMEYPRSLYVMTNAAVPACLVELEFISNSAQEKLLASDEGQKQYANALAEALKSFLMSLPGASEEVEVQSLASPSSPAVEKSVAMEEPPVQPAKIDKSFFNKKKKLKT